MRKCENCIWCEQCGCEAICDSYTPLSNEEENEIAAVEYFFDITNRQHEYMSEYYELND